MYLESFQRRASFPFLRRARGLYYTALRIATAVLYVALAGELAAMGLL